ncbi:hypothetical protein COT97_02985 [Candidatus Falkowbacteria bacterium CG10_big_fil_rev_8_21_14_0_10_39_11]|uniref:Uncharacterized protein n=1 Tax=Candidatus Falkowbacteria bacterium CG10_big_fil_rev_8_21_14_0_10_39_11 TaxID=1974565 RepID=A0A2H0V706_9BACT|nr:MAG: hypothetical protein COT97_02985 [Candidatus Falkowbacteria bacterium CG10_big_fil_rev_8_21_14_0_10_39_11]
MKRRFKDLLWVVLITIAVAGVREYFSIEDVKECLRTEVDTDDCLETAKGLLFYEQEYVKEVLSKIVMADSKAENVDFVLAQAIEYDLDQSYFMYEYQEVITNTDDYALKYRIALASGNVASVSQALQAWLDTASRQDTTIDCCDEYNRLGEPIWSQLKAEPKQSLCLCCIPKLDSPEKKLRVANDCGLSADQVQAIHFKVIDDLRASKNYSAAILYAKNNHVNYPFCQADVINSFGFELLNYDNVKDALMWIELWADQLVASSFSDHDMNLVMVLKASKLYQSGDVKGSIQLLNKYGIDVMIMHALLDREDGFKYLKSLYYSQKLVKGQE